MLTLMNIVFYT